MRVDLFCESGSEYGLGHFYRCLKLIALCVKIPQVSAITLHHRGDFILKDIDSLLPCAAQYYLPIEFKHYEWLATQPESLDMVFIDSYEADIRFYHQMSYHAKALICLDDEFRDVYPSHSYILNGTPNAQIHYNKNDKILAGEQYALLPLDLSSKKQPPKTPPLQILITMGGVDSANHTQALLDALSENSHLLSESYLHLILGGGYLHTLQIPLSLESQVKIHHDLSPSDFIATASQCHIAISAGGGSMIELIALQIPSIIIQTAPNQTFQVTQWASIGAIMPAQNIAQVLSLLPILQSSYNQMHSRLCQIQMGTYLLNALQDIAQTIQTPYQIQKSPNASFSLEARDFTTLNETEKELVFSMRNHPQITPWMYSNTISKESHLNFLNKLHEDKTRQYWLVKSQEEAIGVGSLTRINFTHKHAYIGIYKNPFSSLPHKGRQILTFLQTQAFDVLGLHTLHLEVLETNTRAIRFYENMGYTKEGILSEFIYKDSRYYNVI